MQPCRAAVMHGFRKPVCRGSARTESVLLSRGCRKWITVVHYSVLKQDTIFRIPFR